MRIMSHTQESFFLVKPLKMRINLSAIYKNILLSMCIKSLLVRPKRHTGFQSHDFNLREDFQHFSLTWLIYPGCILRGFGMGFQIMLCTDAR